MINVSDEENLQWAILGFGFIARTSQAALGFLVLQTYNALWSILLGGFSEVLALVENPHLKPFLSLTCS